MNEFKIEHGVPMPESVGKGWRTKYPFGQMDVGDSFLVKNVDNDTTKVRAAMSYYGTRNDKKFATRTVNEGGDVRVWRTK